jgi:hypothetical protein
LGTAPKGGGYTILPGFMIPSGSSACWIEREPESERLARLGTTDPQPFSRMGSAAQRPQPHHRWRRCMLPKRFGQRPFRIHLEFEGGGPCTGLVWKSETNLE